MTGLRALVVDDERLARHDLARLLGELDDIAEVLTAGSGSDALRMLAERDDVDALFLDIQMPGLDGVELVKVLRNFKNPPVVAFVTAYDEYAVDAFDLDVCDYLMKPVDQDRLADAVRRMHQRVRPAKASTPVSVGSALPKLVGKVGSRSFTIDRDEVSVVEAAGDYVRVHVGSASYLVRESISSLTSAWSRNGFVRIHRSYLVRARDISEVRTLDAKRSVVVGDMALPVSRRYTRLLQEYLGAPAE